MPNIETGIYRHYKGGVYYVIGTGSHTENGTRLVAYFDLKKGGLYFRPESMFSDRVKHEGRFRKRFTRSLHIETELKEKNQQIAQHLFILDSVASDPMNAARLLFDDAMKTRKAILEKMINEPEPDENSEQTDGQENGEVKNA